MPESTQTVAAPPFFLSYSRSDGAYVKTFFDDLSEEVAQRSGEATPAFLDTSQPPGARWLTTTGRALGTCRVLVPVYSPNFFSSDYCGREWHCFQQRLSGFTAAQTPIVPVLWLPPHDPMPPAVTGYMDTRHWGSETYRKYGLRQLVRNRRYREDYLDLVADLALAIVAAGANPAPVAAVTPDLADAPNAFTVPAAPLQAAVKAARRHGGEGPKRIHFVVVAGGREEMRPHRSDIEYYGDEGDDWRPYHPQIAYALAAHAQGLASVREFKSSVLTASKELERFLEASERNREIVILLVDAWATKLAELAEVLRRYDRRRFGNTAVVVPFNPDDLETKRSAERLRSTLSDTLWRVTADAPSRTFRDDVEGADTFDAAVGDVISELRQRIVRTCLPVRKAAPGRAIPKPSISGPGG